MFHCWYIYIRDREERELFSSVPSRCFGYVKEPQAYRLSTTICLKAILECQACSGEAFDTSFTSSSLKPTTYQSISWTLYHYTILSYQLINVLRSCSRNIRFSLNFKCVSPSRFAGTQNMLAFNLQLEVLKMFLAAWCDGGSEAAKVRERSMQIERLFW